MSSNTVQSTLSLWNSLQICSQSLSKQVLHAFNVLLYILFRPWQKGQVLHIWKTNQILENYWTLFDTNYGVTTGNLIGPNSSIESSCANRPKHNFSQAQRQSYGPMVMADQRASRFLSIANGQQIPPPWVCESPPKHTWFGWLDWLLGWLVRSHAVAFCEEHLWNHQCVAIKLSRKDVWYTDPVYMRMFCQPMCNWKTRTKYFDISTIESI